MTEETLPGFLANYKIVRPGPVDTSNMYLEIYICTRTSKYICTWAIQKLTRLDKIFVLPTISVLNKILAPDVFDYGDSKSESWHRAKKI